MKQGTNHFESLRAAIRYYADCGFSPDAVADKIATGEIVIGRPWPKSIYARVYLDPSERRYFVVHRARRKN